MNYLIIFPSSVFLHDKRAVTQKKEGRGESGQPPGMGRGAAGGGGGGGAWRALRTGDNEWEEVLERCRRGRGKRLRGKQTAGPQSMKVIIIGCMHEEALPCPTVHQQPSLPISPAGIGAATKVVRSCLLWASFWVAPQVCFHSSHPGVNGEYFKLQNPLL